MADPMEMVREAVRPFIAREVPDWTPPGELFTITVKAREVRALVAALTALSQLEAKAEAAKLAAVEAKEKEWAGRLERIVSRFGEAMEPRLGKDYDWDDPADAVGDFEDLVAAEAEARGIEWAIDIVKGARYLSADAAIGLVRDLRALIPAPAAGNGGMT